VFHALSRENIRQIVNLELEKVSERLTDHNVKLDATEKALDHLATEGYDPDMGARPLRRVIQQKIEDRLSDALLAKEFMDGDTIRIDVGEDNEIILKREDPLTEQALGI
jgi:ATP-dependent Clp protease ATP-binding subunit ClpC